jgi:predicted acetyltransferase
MLYQLIEPYDSDMDLRDAFLDMARESVESGEEAYEKEQAIADEDYAWYLQAMSDMKKGLNLKEGYVPQSTFWLIDQTGRVIGVSRLRHCLSPQLEDEGGHIGYDIRPSCRRQGFGTLILAKTLVKAADLALERVLVTCDHDNLMSRRIIERNGGKLASESRSSRSKTVQARYWIELNPND